MQIKAIFSECSMNSWLDIAEHLKQEHGWNLCYWIATSKFERAIKKKFPEVVFHESIDAARGINAHTFADIELIPLDQKLLADFSFCELIVLNMMNRMDPMNIFGYEERIRLYHKYLRYWITVIDTLKPDVVVAPVVPHLMYDYVLYEICKKKGIKTIMFYHTPIEPLIFPIGRFEDGSHVIKTTYAKLQKSLNEQNMVLSESTQKYLANMTGDYAQAIPWYLKKNLEKQSVIKKMTEAPRSFFDMIESGKYPGEWLLTTEHYIKEKGKKIEESDVRGMKYLWYRKKGEKKKSYLKKHYNKLTKSIDFDCPYVYVPIHYQPERSTSPEAGIFSNQLLMIDLISKCVPKGWSVYVKEHPMQFNKKTSGECSRTVDFYDDIASLANVKLVALSSSSFDLIDNSKAVATATGMVGWESILRGKPVLVFGHAWYKECEGVFFTTTKETCKNALSKISAGYTVDEKLVKLFAYVLEKVCVRAYIAPDCEKISGISHDKNVSMLTDTLHKFYSQSF